jgi:tricarballylate dehydrogenase
VAILPAKMTLYGIMVDINGKRFVDEGEDFFSYTYAKCGREVLRLPWRTAYQIFDNKTRPLLRSEYNCGFHVSAGSIEALAKKLPGLDWGNVVKTVNEFQCRYERCAVRSIEARR